MKTTAPPEGFGAFRGVLRPTLLTLLGALLVLREGWLVGSCGLLGALVVIVAAYLITGTTVLSVSSIATNTRVRAGGAFAIIAQALGVEAGGAIGIPLYIAQCASVALYLFAFSEAWAHLFPTHPTAVVVVAAFLVVVALAWRSADAAFRAQAPLLVVVALALASAWFGVFTAEPSTAASVPLVPQVGMREAFPIFFPAATGIMVGVGMSGSLANPRDSIPRGLLGAWGISLGIYLLTAFWYDAVASPAELVAVPTIMVTKAALGPLVIIGLLCTTLMAALSSLVAAPRLLCAMGEQRVVPWGSRIAEKNEAGEPRIAVAVSAGVAGLCLLSGSLDAIAPFVTSVFILTYLAIQFVVFIEQRLGMLSFRPTFALAPSVPLIGLIAAGTALVLCSPVAGVLGAVAIGGIYTWLRRRQLHTPWETVRSGVDIRVADWVARRVAGLERPERAWTPDVLIPVLDAAEARGMSQVVNRLTDRVGSVRLVGLSGEAEVDGELDALAAQLRASGSHTTATTLDAGDFTRGVAVVIDALRGLMFTPNLVLVDGTLHAQDELQQILDHCQKRQVGLAVYLPHPSGGLGRARDVTVWLSERSPDWDLQIHNINLDLPVLLAYVLIREERGRMRLATVIDDAQHEPAAKAFLRRIRDMGRLPNDTRTVVCEGDFITAVKDSEYADIHIFGIATTVDSARLEAIRDAAAGACIFLLDSGQESVLA